jgi:hypothetical protein
MDKNNQSEYLSYKARKWLARVRKNVDESKNELSDWENDFLNSVDERLAKYGRAFSDPDKGAINAPLSLLQGLKIKEIGKKSKPKDNNLEVKSFSKKQSKPLQTKKPLKAKKTLKTKTGFKRKNLLISKNIKKDK